MYAPVAMRADNEAINFFTSDDEEGEGEGEEGESCLLLLVWMIRLRPEWV